MNGRHCAKIENGYVAARAHTDGEIPEGWVECPADMSTSHMKIAYREGQFIQTDESWMPTPSVSMARAMAYPSAGEQLGAIWKAIAPLIEHPEAEDILAKIQAVKDAHPKPSN